MKSIKSLKGVLISFGAAVLFLTGCARAPSGRQIFSKSEGQIVGGRLTQLTSPGANSTVGIWLTKGSPDDQSQPSMVCTGILIGHNTVLTAAHCQSPDYKVQYVVFSPDFSAASRNPAQFLRPILSFVTHPTWDAAKQSAARPANKVDLALVRFSGSLPNGFQPAEIYQGPKPIAGTKLTIMGYGNTDTNADDSGILRVTQTEVVNVELFSGFRIEGANPVQGEQDSNPTNAPDMFAMNASTSGICHGDSGGPSYLIQNGKVLLVGVTTAIFGSSVLNAPVAACHSFSTHTLVSPHMDWISTPAPSIP